MQLLSGLSLFPFLFGGTFIEGPNLWSDRILSPFPFLFGGTFIEGRGDAVACRHVQAFPFLFGGTFIEGLQMSPSSVTASGNFPSFSEGLSLRVTFLRWV